LRCDLKTGVDCALATYSGVERAVPKTACCQFHQTARNLVCPMSGGSVRQLGRIMGDCPEIRSEQRLTRDFQLMTCVSSSGWLPLYALSYLVLNCGDQALKNHQGATLVVEHYPTSSCPKLIWDFAPSTCGLFRFEALGR